MFHYTASQGPLLTCTVQHFLSQHSSCTEKKFSGWDRSPAAIPWASCLQGVHKELQVQPSSQVFCPQVHHNQLCFASPLKYFQTHQIMIPWKRFSHLLRVFLPPEALGALQRETSSAVLVLQRGKLHPGGKDGKAQAPGRWVGTSPHCLQQSMCLLLTPT